MRFRVDELEKLPTISRGQAADLKIATEGTRVWLSRCTVEDGEPYNNKVTIEKLYNGKWTVVDEYEG